MASGESRGGRQWAMLVLAIVLIAVAVVIIRPRLSGQSPAASASDRVYVCVETGKPFNYTLKTGDKEPVLSPYTGKPTGYLAEACYWTKDPDGNWVAKSQPTYVVLKTRINPSSTEKTFCPDCGREVVLHNPLPPPELMEAARAGSR